MSKTHILPCSCVSAYQDGKYGNGRRVHNEKASEKKSAVKEATCTVCSKVQNVHGGGGK